MHTPHRTAHRTTTSALLVAAAAAMALGACTDADSSESSDTVTATTVTATTVTSDTVTATTMLPTDPSAPASTAAPSPTWSSADTDLTDTDVAGLLWMREEEQLAHDVYVVLGDLWGLRIFEKIAESETSHTGAVTDLLGRFGVADPAAGNEPGTFVDPALQDLYDQLIADGTESLEAALRVGAFIEELDIDDLQVRSAATDVADIITVYANLERGSRNHLRAFVSQLEQRGLTYEPTELDAATFDAIVSSETERGHDG